MYLSAMFQATTTLCLLKPQPPLRCPAAADARARPPPRHRWLDAHQRKPMLVRRAVGDARGPSSPFSAKSPNAASKVRRRWPAWPFYNWACISIRPLAGASVCLLVVTIPPRKRAHATPPHEFLYWPAWPTVVVALPYIQQKCAGIPTC